MQLHATATTARHAVQVVGVGISAGRAGGQIGGQRSMVEARRARKGRDGFQHELISCCRWNDECLAIVMLAYANKRSLGQGAL